MNAKTCNQYHSAAFSNPLPYCLMGFLAIQDNEGNRGGAIYNEGKVTMFKNSNFFDNACAVRD